MRKPLTIANKIALLELLKLFSVKEVSSQTGFSVRVISKYRQIYKAYSPVMIDKAVKQLIIDEDADGAISYERISKCAHEHLFVKCPHCKGVWSEKDKIILLALINKYEPEIEKIRFSQTI